MEEAQYHPLLQLSSVVVCCSVCCPVGNQEARRVQTPDSQLIATIGWWREDEDPKKTHPQSCILESDTQHGCLPLRITEV